MQIKSGKHNNLAKLLKNMPMIAFVIVFLLAGANVLWTKPVVVSDTENFINWAASISSKNFNIFAFSKEALSDKELSSPTTAYLLVSFLIAVAKEVSPQYWDYLMAFLNVSAVAGTAALLLSLVRNLRLTSAVLSMSALALFILPIDTWYWAKFIMTDSIYIFISFAAFYFLASYLESSLHQSRTVLAGAALTFAFLAVFTRPVGPICLIVTLLGLVFGPRLASATKSGGFFFSTRIWLYIGLGVILATLAGFGMHSFAAFDPEIMRNTFFYKFFEAINRTYLQGTIVVGRPETFKSPPHYVIDFFNMTLLKYAAYFNFAPMSWSATHKFAEILFAALVFSLSLIGLVDAIYWRRSSFRVVLVLIIAATVHFSASVSAMTFVDFDYRYRLPILSMCIVSALFGIDALVIQYEARMKARHGYRVT